MKTKKKSTAKKTAVLTTPQPDNNDILEYVEENSEEAENLDLETSKLNTRADDNLYGSVLSYGFFQNKLRNTPLLTPEQERRLTDELLFQREKHDQALLRLIMLILGLKFMNKAQLTKFKQLMPYCFEFKSLPFVQWQAKRKKTAQEQLMLKKAKRYFSMVAKRKQLSKEKQRIVISLNNFFKDISLLPSSNKINGHFIKLTEIGQKLELDDDTKQKIEMTWHDLFEAKDHLHRLDEAFFYPNLKLVINVAKRYIGTAMDLNDLIQDGHIGLHKTASKFNPHFQDPNGTTKFSTYATWWIQQTMTRGLQSTIALVRKPIHIHERNRKIIKAFKMIKTKRPDMNKDDMIKLISQELKLDPQKISDLYKSFAPPVSLAHPINDDDTVLEDFIDDKTKPTAEDHAIQAELTQSINKVLKALTPKERVIIEKRYGLFDGKIYTLDEIGQEYQVTRERIRQIEAKALKKLSHPKRKKILQSFIKQ